MIDLLAAVLLQAPPLPGQAAPAAATAPAGAEAAAAPAAQAADPGSFFWILIPVMLVILILPMFTQRKERKKRESMLSSLSKHDRVQTVGGLIGTIVEIKGGEVVLRVDDSAKVNMTFARSAVSDVLDKAKSAD